MASANDRLKGTVTWFDIFRGYGFITPEDGGKDLFVRRSSMKAVGYRSPVGEAVEFLVSMDKGWRTAVSVTGPGGAHIMCNFRRPSDEEKEERNWAELPRDVLRVIFNKITAVEVIRSAQYVCRPWRQLSFEPETWRHIVVRMQPDSMHMRALEFLAMLAVQRSQGCVENFYLKSLFCKTNRLLVYMSRRTTKLRRLCFISICNMSEKALAQAIREFPMLEELEISFCFFSSKLVEVVGPACLQLKTLRLNGSSHKHTILHGSVSNENVDAVAFSIAKHLQQLQCLQLIGNRLTNTGLLSILNNCPNIESLDIRACYNVQFSDENLRSKCAKIKELRPPEDSTADFEYNKFIKHPVAFDANPRGYRL